MGFARHRTLQLRELLGAQFDPAFLFMGFNLLSTRLTQGCSAPAQSLAFGASGGWPSRPFSAVRALLCGHRLVGGVFGAMGKDSRPEIDATPNTAPELATEAPSRFAAPLAALIPPSILMTSTGSSRASRCQLFLAVWSWGLSRFFRLCTLIMVAVALNPRLGPVRPYQSHYSAEDPRIGPTWPVLLIVHRLFWLALLRAFHAYRKQAHRAFPCLRFVDAYILTGR